MEFVVYAINFLYWLDSFIQNRNTAEDKPWLPHLIRLGLEKPKNIFLVNFTFDGGEFLVYYILVIIVLELLLGKHLLLTACAEYFACFPML